MNSKLLSVGVVVSQRELFDCWPLNEDQRGNRKKLNAPNEVEVTYIGPDELR
jgi:hypothetical protein